MNRRALFGAGAVPFATALPLGCGVIDAIYKGDRSGWWYANLHLPNGSPLVISMKTEREMLALARYLTNVG